MRGRGEQPRSDAAPGPREPGPGPVSAARQDPQGNIRRRPGWRRKEGEVIFGRHDAGGREPDLGTQTAFHRNRNRNYPIHRRIQRQELRPHHRAMARYARHVHTLHRQGRPIGACRRHASPRSPRGCPGTTADSVIQYPRWPEKNDRRVRRQRSCSVAEIHRRHYWGILMELQPLLTGTRVTLQVRRSMCRPRRRP